MHSAIARSSLSSPIAPRAWHALVALLAFFGIVASGGPAAALGPASETGTVRYTYEQADHAYESLIFGAPVSVGSANEDLIGPLAHRASDATPAVLAARGADDSAQISTTLTVEVVASVGDPAGSILRPSGPIGDVYDFAATFVAPRVTGTVWDDVVETGARYPGTEVPRSFRLGLDDGTEVWVHPNATEHLAERVLNAGATGPVTTQSQIRSLQTAVSEVNRQGVSLGQMYNVSGWQLQFSMRSTDDLVVVNHALYTG